MVGDLAEPRSLRHSRTRLSFFTTGQGVVHRACWLRSIFRTRHDDEVLCSAERTGRPPTLVAAYVEATNSFDLEQLMATFAEDALVNDQLRGYWGKPCFAMTDLN